MRYQDPDRWEAEFATIDAATGEYVIPSGTYVARCFGGAGTYNGGNLKVSIGK